jgi:para-nitrobenzyl esterase
MQVVKLDSGYISGTVVGEPDKPVCVNRGIPYAAPPVGDLRWKPPQPVTPWSGIRECTAFSKVTPQTPVVGQVPAERLAQSEDCLYLNVSTPARDTLESLPVMVWIHGGNFQEGSGNDTLYNGLRLPLNGVVLVTINFRIGPFGFIAHPLLSRESINHLSGNYSFLDIKAALEWVRSNIAAFGGNHKNITIFGQSSSGATVSCFISSPLVKGLFHRAIGQSTGPARGTPLAEMEARGEKVFAKLGVDKERDPLAAARALPWQKIIEAGQAANSEVKALGGMWNPAIDGWFLPDSPPKTFAAGKQNVVSFIMGANDNNMEKYGDNGMVPAYTNRCAGANRIGQAGYIYVFNHVPARWKSEGSSSGHAMELPYVFGRWGDNGVSWASYVSVWANRAGAKSPDPGLTEVDKKVSELMMTIWTNFAKTGNPSIEGVVNWPAWDEDKDQYLYITEKLEIRSGFSKVGQK